VLESARAAVEREIQFGPFRLYPGKRLLLEADKTLRLGSRAWEILIALIERSGDIVSKEELMVRIWPDTLVVEGNLAVHIAALRRALGDGHDGNRYIVTVPGRGYSFVAPIKIAEALRPWPPQVPAIEHVHNLPVQLTRLIGRSETVSQLADQLQHTRLLTITGAAGIGKTSVALAVAEHLIGIYEHGTWLVDLAPLGDPLLVPSAVASVLGLGIRSENPLPSLAAALRDKRMLLVLDNCEHIIEAAASLTDAVLKGAPGVRILATSREQMRAQGERVYRLAPLDSPPLTARPTAADALQYPAVQLFVERATAAITEFKLDDADIAIVADICRRLDGLPLAIELAAGRVAGFGVRGLAAFMEDRLRLLRGGDRTALPRHQTMEATLDWSYSLLTEPQQFVLLSLAIFAGGFTLQAAGAVIADATHHENDVIDHVTELVAKSLVTTDVSGAEPRLRLLETTRVYASAKLEASGQREVIGRRHAEYYRDLLRTANAAAGEAAAGDWHTSYSSEIDNVRAALAATFASRGNAATAVALAAASVPLWFEMSLLTECRVWTNAALAWLDDAAAQSTREEMVLQTAFGLSVMYTQGRTGRARAALTRASELAESFQNLDYLLRSLSALALFCIRLEDFRSALALAYRAEGIAKGLADIVAISTVDCIIATSLFFLGDYNEALISARRVHRHATPIEQRAQIVRSGMDYSILAHCISTQILWLQGFPERSSQAARSVLGDALECGHPASLCQALAWCGCRIPLRLGDLETAESSIARLEGEAQRHGLRSYHALGLGFEGQLCAKRGDIVAGERLLRDCLDGLRNAQYENIYTGFLSGLAEILAAAGRLEEGLAVADEALQRTERNQAFWWMPEALRIKGEILLLSDKANAMTAEDHFRRSLDLAREQKALSWELRSGMSLARLWGVRGRIREGRDLLTTIYDRFTEGFETADLRAAMQLLDDYADGRAC